MFGPSNATHWAACALFGAAALWIGVVGVMWFRSTTMRDWTVWCHAIGMTAIVLILTPAMIYFAWPAGAQVPPGGVNGNCTVFGNNNINCSNINIAPPRGAFTADLGNQLLAHMQTKKPVMLQTVGGSPDQGIGDDVQKFLQDNGYTVNRTSIGMMIPPPDRPFSFTDTPNQYVVTVAPSAH